MNANVEIDAGICGFHTTVDVSSEDGQNVTFTISSGCENVSCYGVALAGKGVIDAYEEIAKERDSVVLGTARDCFKGCCAACAVPVGVFKAMQVAAGLALPKDISIRMEGVV